MTVWIQDAVCANSLGGSLDECACALSGLNAPGLKKLKGYLTHGREAVLGTTACAELPDLAKWPDHNTRNNALTALCAEQLKTKINELVNRFGPSRIAVVMGTSTSGLFESGEEVKRSLHGESSGNWYYQMQELSDPAAFLSDYLKLSGPAYTVSTACTSSARAVISAVRMLDAGLADAVIAGGADTLCAMSVSGFDSMGVLSADLCTPFCKGRHGITIGEGAGLVLLSRDRAEIAVLGYGESSDGYHISSPDPEGNGALKAMEMALRKAGLKPDDLGYISLHGTATVLNDAMESKAVYRLTQGKVPCSSTKYLTGHTLGAAGITSLCLNYAIIKKSLCLPTQNFQMAPLDPEIPDCGLINTRTERLSRPVAMSNTFAFGGNNACIICGEP